ncbi:TPA: hypothetical protein KD105_004626 [Vibrio parahaemolyticus]|nr:hypothetical protein [Vibrio parahaemolyticus]HBC3607266.1 hypothetical protein [Vibrio parahaemolyticus]
MKPAYGHAMQLKLDQLWYEGWAKFDRWEVLTFFERKRVTRAVWQEIEEMWADMFHDPKNYEPLMIVKVRSEDNVTTPHSFLLINKNQTEDI